MQIADAVVVHCKHDKMVGVSELKPHPRNPNTHGDEQIRLLAKMIVTQGWRCPITVSNRSGFIVRGHARLLAAQAAGLEQVPVDYQNYADEATELADLVADNRIAELAELDRPMLKDVLEELDTGALDMELTGFTDDALKELMSEFHVAPEEDDFDAEAEAAKIGEPISKRGELWLLGKHRLMCGDSTCAIDVERLMAGAKPHLCVTDPPYGVNYDPAWRNVEAAKGNLAYAACRVGQVTNDDRADWGEAWALVPGDVIYSWHPAGAPSLIHAGALQDSGFALRMQIIWAKPNFVIGRGDYHVQHEPCWYAVRIDKPSRRTKDRTQTTLWEINLDKNVEGGHSAQKPVECMARPIRNHEGDVYDPFVGSGTTIIASEQIGRICYAMEIEPRYVDVAVKRWEQYTGRKADLEHDVTAEET